MAESVERNVYLNPPSTGEMRVLKKFLVISLSAHILFLILDKINFFDRTAPLIDEWAIDVDLAIEGIGSKDSALPKAKEGEEAAVPKNMLPQLPKKFSIDEAQKPEEAVPDPDSLEKPKVNEQDTGQKTAEEDPLKLKVDEDEKNVLTKKDALRRLALENLRQQNKESQLQAEKSAALARIKTDDANTVPSSDEAALGLAKKKYSSVLKKAVSRHYAIPEAYNMKNADLQVIIAIVVNERGELTSSVVHQPSGDEVFDQIALKAVNDASPLPQPPQGQAGETIYLKFSPKSF